MLLAIDVGNTQTVIGVFEDDQWEHVWRTRTASNTTYDELHVELLGLFNAFGVQTSQITGVALSSVVPFLTDTWRIAIHHMFHLEVIESTRKNADGLMDFSAYVNGDLGQDRIADCVAARQLYGGPVIVVDFGTATNMEAVDGSGCFCGGVIAPGVRTSMDALVSRAALLPEVGLDRPPVALGLSTQTAMQIGLVYGEVDRVDGIVRRMWRQLGYAHTRVIATGGLGNVMGPLCETVSLVDNRLTLQGLRFIYDHVLAKTHTKPSDYVLKGDSGAKALAPEKFVNRTSEASAGDTPEANAADADHASKTMKE